MMDNELVVKLVTLATAADAAERERLLKELTVEKDREDVCVKFLKFTKKEISRMPQEFRYLFSINGLRAHIRKRIRGGCVDYEARCRMKGVDVSVSSKSIEDTKNRFIQKLFDLREEQDRQKARLYEDFCLEYFEKFRKRRVTEKTYKNDLYRSNRYIFPTIGKKRLDRITPTDCQSILDSLSERGMGKSADEVYSLMNQVFKGAIAHGLIERNPLAVVVHQQHEREHGVALTKKEEAQLVSCTSPFRLYFLIALYTGLRPCEYDTVRREGDMLIAQNKKRKNGKTAYKRIPIGPMLAPHLKGLTEFSFPSEKTLFNHLHKLFDHRLYDLRTTFNTRCVECHVDETARKLMMGHSLGALGNAYTDVSDSFLKEEISKFFYSLPNGE